MAYLPLRKSPIQLPPASIQPANPLRAFSDQLLSCRFQFGVSPAGGLQSAIRCEVGRAGPRPHRPPQRSRIVLECAGGSPNTAVADKLGVTYQSVGKWRQRFLARRLAGLLDEPRPGARSCAGSCRISGTGQRSSAQGYLDAELTATSPKARGRVEWPRSNAHNCRAVARGQAKSTIEDY